MPLKPNIQNTEPLATYILCIHHKKYDFINPNFKTKFQEVLTTQFEIHATYTNNLNTTPTNITVNTSIQWKNKTTYI
jgi:hypothetical protein